MTTMSDPAVNPAHYRNAAGVQIIEVIRYMPFSLGNAVKYTYRNARKANPIQDLEKALWYLEDYAKHPEVVTSRPRITEDLVARVLEGVHPFERASFLGLLAVADASLNDMDSLQEAVDEVRTLVQERLTSLS